MVTFDLCETTPSHGETSIVPVLETAHGRMRRRQRGIDKKDLQAAKKHGVKHRHNYKSNGNVTFRYTYKDIVYIVDGVTDQEVTCYAVPLKLDIVPSSIDRENEHKEAQKRIRTDLDSWTSNTVIVVDTSGSMKTSDMWGTKTRLGAVWVSIALDFIAHRLESGEGHPTDVVSVVTLGPEARTLICEAPCTWVLYNMIVAIYTDKTILPYGHGPFLPSLEKAESLLTRNSNASCALALIFLSDGAPSDALVGKGYSVDEWKHRIATKVENLAKQFGRRLAFTAIGIGDSKDFKALEQMVNAALDYGVSAELRLPSMASASLGEAFTSVATTLTTTKREMTDAVTLTQRKVRNVSRESRKKAKQEISVVSNDDFWIYGQNDVKRTVYKEWFEGREKKKEWHPTSLEHPDAKYVAFCKEPFGEGAERFAYRFFELAADAKTIVGPPLVAKESRLVFELESQEDTGNEKARNKFARTFCSTQQLARRVATEFNNKLDETQRVHPNTPRVIFQDCSVYQLKDNKLGILSVLVESKLDNSQWHKWNSNNGFVEGMKQAPRYTQEKLRTDLTTLAAEFGLGTIDKGNEEEKEDNTADQDDRTALGKPPMLFTASQVAQAFSHFTYWASGRKRLVCDLQGVFDAQTNLLKFSDPVIHYHDPSNNRRGVHGSADRGRRGVDLFFQTHDNYCTPLCKLMIRGFRRPQNMGKLQREDDDIPVEITKKGRLELSS